ncbi:MAG: DNA ligase D, partial [Marinobacter sp.]
QVTLLTRNGKDWTRRFGEVVKALKALPVDQALIDGEVVVPEPDGSTSFRKLQEWLSSRGSKDRPVYQVFDLLYLDGYDLQQSPLTERKAALAQMLASAGITGDTIRYSDHMQGQGERFYEQVCEMGLEGIVSKQASATYRNGRHRSWQKTKCTRQDEFVVGGFTRPSGARQGFGSLLLGAFDGDRMVYAGRVGSGFSGRQLSALHRRLKALARKTSPFDGEVPDAAGVQWVTPQIVVDVEFTERTGSGALRHPVFRGLREDKSASEVQMMKQDQPSGGARQQQTRTARSGDPVVAGVTITHPDRILYPEHGITKLDVARYYEDVEAHILPHLANRPLSLLRCPEGLEGDCFFQKHPERNFAPEVPRTEIAEKQGGTSSYLYVTSAAHLVALVQFGVMEFHPWGATISDVEKPDTLIFDLDPGPDVPWRAISQAASSLKERLDDLGLASFLQASGGKGLHLVVPVEPEWGWDPMKSFAQGIAQAHARNDPKRFTTNMSKSKRKGKVFLDYLRNGRGNTSIARYSTRAREHATVATPLRWDELSEKATSNRYTVTNLRRRLSALKGDPWEGYEQARNTIPKALLNEYQGE